MKGFINFIRERGIVGLAVGFMLGGAVSKIVASLVNNVINPVIGLALGRVDLAERALNFGGASVMYGAFIASIVDFVVVAVVVYVGFRWLRLEKLDKKKE